MDNDVANPAGWLKTNLVSQQDYKNPLIAKAMISVLDTAVMRANSSSFDKFAREVEDSYGRWQRLAFGI